MDIKVIVLPGGRVEVSVDGDVSYEQAAMVTNALLDQLSKALPGITASGGIESHRPGGPEHAHLVQHQHVGN